MKKNILFSLIMSVILLFSACSTNDDCIYDFTDSSLVTFMADTYTMPGISPSDNGTIYVPVFRGNTNGSATVNFELSGGSDVFSLESNSVTFPHGANQSMIGISFDFDNVSPAPVKLTISISEDSEDQLAINAVTSTTITVSRKLTYNLVGTGQFESTFIFEDSWTQDLLKAEEGNCYSLPDCYVSGAPMLFAINDNGEVEWYTPDTGVAYSSSYGNFVFKNPEASIVDIEGVKYLVVSCMVNLANYKKDDPFGAGIVDEIMYRLPDEFEMP